MKTKINFNPYKITWCFLIPVKGIALKNDLKNKILKRGVFNSNLHFWAANKEIAKSKLKNLKGLLNKDYKILFITDKQFGLIQTDYKLKKTNLLDIATKKQIKDMFIF